MARIFLSYDRDDLARARPIAAALEKAGHSVWWDRHIRGGAQYSKEIEQALDQADAVVVLWSERSVESPWVRDEAAVGRDSGKLVPISLDGTEPPMGFRQFQTVQLADDSGRRERAARLQDVLTAIVRLDGARTASDAAPTEQAADRATHPRKRRWIGILVLGVAAIVAAVGLWRWWPQGAGVPVVAIRAADPSPQSRSLARDLFVSLGAAQSGRAESVQLVHGDAHDTPDLILEIFASSPTADRGASLVLLSARDRQLLSSQDLSAPAGRAGKLKTSLDTAAKATLDCASAASGTHPAVRLEVLKHYLGACTRFHSLYGMEDVSILIPQLADVVRREPQFLAARKQLLLAGAFMRSIPTEVAKPSPRWLQAQVGAARRVNGVMPELGLAELELLPVTDFSGRIRRVDELRSEYPDNMFVLGVRAEQLMLVGRNNDAVVDAERTARLDPLAPYSRSEYARALAFSGRLSRAFEELNAFEPFPDVAMSLTDTRFRLNMRYGNPRPALDILRMYGTSKMHEAFLLARVDPTPANVERAVGLARSVAAERSFYAPFSEVLVAFGRDDEVFDTLMRVPRGRVDQFLLQTLFRPTLRNLRQNPRFLRIAQRYGLLDYWRESGAWPDFCSEPGLPYDCKKEAARLRS